MCGKSAPSAPHTIGCVLAGDEAFVVPALDAVEAAATAAMAVEATVIRIHKPRGG